MPPAKLSHVCFRLTIPFLLGLLSISIESPVVVKAQAIPAGSPSPRWSRFETYGGYSYLNPSNSSTSSYKVQPQGAGGSFSVTDYVNHFLGFEGQVDLFPNRSDASTLRLEAGPELRSTLRNFIPFFHVLGGGARAAGPQAQSSSWGLGVTAGAGFDYVIPKFGGHISLRPLQADFAYTRITYEGLESARVNGFLSQLSAGLVLRLGESTPGRQLQMGCTVDMVEVFPGELITITAHLLDASSKHLPTFRWTSTGGQPKGTNDVVLIDTQTLAAGDYVATGTVHQASRSSGTAHCTVEFRVRQFQPPVVSCSANPATSLQNGTVSIHTVARSPQNRLLTYAYSASSGVIVGSGPNVNLNVASAPLGEVHVSCRVTDDLSQTATASAVIRIDAPEMPKSVQPPISCVVTFDKEEQSATLLNHMARKCLDQIAMDLTNQPTATLILLAKHSTDEPPDVAALRALNAAEYLIHQRNVDPRRVKLLSGGGFGRVVDSYLLPANQVFLHGDAVTIDASSLKRRDPLYIKPSDAPNFNLPQR